MAIKLQTEPIIVSGGVVWTGCSNDDLYHDAAVAHALIQAIEEFTIWQPVNRVNWADNPTKLLERATTILRSDFGIEDSQP